MKTNLLNAIAVAIVMTTCYNCSIEPIDNAQSEILAEQNSVNLTEPSAASCTDSNPKVKILNNGTVSADFQIYDGSGLMIHAIEAIEPGTVSDWFDFPEGIVVFNIVMDSFSDQKVSYTMATCTEIVMEIDINNQLTDVQPQSSSN